MNKQKTPLEFAKTWGANSVLVHSKFLFVKNQNLLNVDYYLSKSTYIFSYYSFLKPITKYTHLASPKDIFNNPFLKIRKQHNNYLPQSLKVNPELRVPIDSRSLSLSVSSLLELELSTLFDFLYLLIGTSKCFSLSRCRLSLLL